MMHTHNGKTYNFYFLDWKNKSSNARYQELFDQYPNVYRINHRDSLADTLRLCAQLSDSEYFWVVSSLTDYTNFNFEDYNELSLEPYVQVFGGNTWFAGRDAVAQLPTNISQIDALPNLHFVNTDLKTDAFLVDNFYFLDWKNKSSNARYQELCNRYSSVHRINLQDSLADTLRLCAQMSDSEHFWIVSSLTDYTNFKFENHDKIGLDPYVQVFGGNTWFANRKTVAQLPTNISQIDALPNLHFVNTDLSTDKVLLDIVYISNNEPDAEKYYQHLLKTVKTPNKIHRINGIQGRNAAYHAAANISTTPWFFAVFSKLKVQSDFDWTWNPDAIKGPMHYIFHARNPVNGLEYGHMAMVAYNKHLTLSTVHTGLDFVMTRPHDILPILSGTAHYNQSPIVTWRSAFRECLKLKADGSPESMSRLHTWSTCQVGEFGEWSTQGAHDAIEYYDTVNGDFEKLKLSYDWEWLNAYFNDRYNQ